MTIVLNYRHVDDTVRCVESLQRSDYLDQRIVVVDNAEDGPTTAALRRQLDRAVRVISTGDNLGYAGGNNMGIEYAEAWRPDFFWLVNPDTVVEPDTLGMLVAAADEFGDSGVVGSRILYGESNPPRVWFDGGVVDESRWGATSHHGSGSLESKLTDHSVRDVDYVTGASFFMRRSLLGAVGLLPEEYFLYYEETDYCRRVRAAGWRTVIAPRSRMWHFKRSTGLLPAAYYIYYMCRNRIHFGQHYFSVDAEAIIDDLSEFVRSWRERVRQHAPGLLSTYDDLVQRAFDDGRSGRLGRRADIEEIHFATENARQ